MIKRTAIVKLLRHGQCMCFRITPPGGALTVELYVAPDEIDLPLTIDTIRAIGNRKQLPADAQRCVFGAGQALWTLEALCLERPARKWEVEHVPEHTQRLIAARRASLEGGDLS